MCSIHTLWILKSQKVFPIHSMQVVLSASNWEVTMWYVHLLLTLKYRSLSCNTRHCFQIQIFCLQTFLWTIKKIQSRTPYGFQNQISVLNFWNPFLKNSLLVLGSNGLSELWVIISYFSFLARNRYSDGSCKSALEKYFSTYQ